MESLSSKKEHMKGIIAEKKRHLQWLYVLRFFAEEAFAKIQIEFNTLQKPCYFEKGTNTLKAEKSSREKFFAYFIGEVIKK